MTGIIWEFNVKPDQIETFKDHFGSEGLYAKLFSTSDKHVSTSLYEKLPAHGVYMTVDLWSSKRDYETFIEEHRAEYERIDHECASITLSERFVSTFEAITEL